MSGASRDQLSASDIINCAELLLHQLRPDDTVGRMGIYEFLIVLAHDPSQSGYEHTFEAIIERCHSKSASHLEFVATQSQPHEKVRDLLNRLDAQPTRVATLD